MDEETSYGTCDVCEKNDQILTNTKFIYGIQCLCCEPQHFEIVKHCGTCIPEPPEFISFVSKSGVEMIDIEARLLTFTYGN